MPNKTISLRKEDIEWLDKQSNEFNFSEQVRYLMDEMRRFSGVQKACSIKIIVNTKTSDET